MTDSTHTFPKTAEELDAILKPYALQIEFLEEQNRLLRKALFASKSEKRRPDEGEGGSQLHLFNEAEALVEKKKEEAPVTIPEHTRQRPKRKPLPENLPRIEVIEDIDESEKVCACGAELSRIGEDVCEKLDIVPAKIQVVRIVRPKYACKSCEGVETEGPTVKIAPSPPQIIPKGIATPGLIAFVAISKYADALPLYRQKKIFERHGIEISRSTMAGWMVMAARGCKPVMDLLYKELHAGPLINVDETPIQVLKEPGRENTTKSYMWVFRGGPPEKPVLIYRYSPTRSGEVAREVLQGYRGYCQTDAFSGYDGLEQAIEGIELVGCFVHEGQLGLSLQPLTPDLAKQLGIASNKGLVITDVDSGSPAEEAGLKRGDVILQAANKPLASLEQFGALVAKLKPGEGLLLLVQRQEGTIFVVIKAPSEK